jgi:hypothetical protein
MRLTRNWFLTIGIAACLVTATTVTLVRGQYACCWWINPPPPNHGPLIRENQISYHLIPNYRQLNRARSLQATAPLVTVSAFLSRFQYPFADVGQVRKSCRWCKF